MQEVLKLVIGIIFLILGFYIGNFLSKITKEELRKNQRMFRLIVVVFLLIGFGALFFRNDVIMFSSFFIAVVTSRCLIKNKK